MASGFLIYKVCRLLLAGASLVAEHGCYSTGSRVVAPRLSCPAACGIFPDQGSNLHPLRWQAASSPLSHKGSPMRAFRKFFVSLLRAFSRHH